MIIVKPTWCELLRRVDPGSIINPLFESRVLSLSEKEEIKANPSRYKQAEALMEAMMRKSREDYFAFANLLSTIEGLSDLGTRLLGNESN